MSQNMYRVGDCVYFEDSSSGPYHIRRIEELSKNSSGNVEARVAVFYRRRDVSSALLKIADQAERHFEEYYEEEDGKTKPDGFDSSGHTVANGAKEETEEPSSCADVETEVVKEDENKEKTDNEDKTLVDWGVAGLPHGADALTPEKRYRLRLRELFLSRQVETLPATQIRGKCSVTLLSEIETPECYDREDAYFYSLVYDPVQMSLLADKGAIRVGDKYQADMDRVTTKDKEAETEEKTDEEDNKENGDLMIADGEDHEEERKSSSGQTSLSGRGPVEETERELIVYHPHHNLTEREIDQFLVIARSVGTFSRALDPSSSAKLPSLHMTAAAASRDVTVFHAMALLHQANYNLAEGMKFLVPPPSKQHYPLDVDKVTGHNTVSLGGPILIRDQIEEWSASEANLFEEALEKYGKDFSDIRNDFLPWKAMRDIVEYYYMWKTTNRYIDGRKKKSSEEKEAKLKQVYIPNHNKPSANLIGQFNTSSTPITRSIPCEGCQCVSSTNWYAWGPAALQLRLCQSCWTHWKRNGGLVNKHEFDHYDLEGSAEVAGEQSKPLTTPICNSTQNYNKTSAAAQNRVVGSGQVIARLPPNHPQFSSSIPSSSSSHVAVVNSATAAADKPRAPFNLVANLFTRVSRRLTPKAVLNVRKQARRPGKEVNANTIMTFMQSADLVKMVEAAKTITANRIPQSFQKYLMQRVHAQTKRPASSVSASGEPPAKKQAPSTTTLTCNTPPLLLAHPLPSLPPQATGQHVARTTQQNESKRGRLFCFVAGRNLRRHRSTIGRPKLRSAARVPCKEHTDFPPITSI